MTGPAASAKPSKLRVGVVIAALAGLLLATGVIGYVGFDAVFKALTVVGWRGLAFLCVYSAIPFMLLGTAWFVLVPTFPGRRWRSFVLSRGVRDSAGELLPFSQLGGFVIGARAAVLQGVPPLIASSTTIVDVTAEVLAQLGFTGVGVAMLAMRLGTHSTHQALLGAGLVGLALSAAGATGFVIVQRKSSGPVLGLARRFAPALVGRAADFARALDGLYARPLRLAASIGLHLAAWIASAIGVWVALSFAGVGIGLAPVLAIESLVCAVRSAAFVAPMAMGVQEAAYGIVGPLFGLPADLALAISLIKRASTLAVGLPALVLWQVVEGRRLASPRSAALESE
jgi:putative membrane protein